MKTFDVKKTRTFSRFDHNKRTLPNSRLESVLEVQNIKSDVAQNVLNILLERQVLSPIITYYA